MTLELSNILISLSASSTVITIKEKHSLVHSEVIAITFGYFLYLTIAFKVVSLCFLTKDQNSENSEY